MDVNDITLENLDAKIDGLATKTEAGFARAFEQTQGGFDDHRAFTEFAVERLGTRLDGRIDTLTTVVNERFNRVEHRFDGIENRFDRLEKLITEK